MTLLLFGAVAVIVAIACTLAGLILVRRSVRLGRLQDHHEVAGFFIGVLGVIYAVLLAFVVIVVWEQFNESAATVDIEAGQISDVFWLAEGFPAAARDRIQRAVLTYTETVIRDEWPAMEHGDFSPESERTLNDLRAAPLQLDPAPGLEEAIYLVSLQRMTGLSDARSARLGESRSGLPDLMWAILIVGAAITIGFTYFFGVKSLWSQALMTAGLTVMIVLVLVLIFALNHPFRGDLRIGPDALERSVREMTPGATSSPSSYVLELDALRVP